ncbi:hypothetical protein LCGC14_0962160 [marine sediment metagenome]|uniref:Uncharacterized protein n=1 Tax=marine sediment metagenome TaxID=412755 RepID=A0A0F9RKR1_9ZZZZ
MAESFISQKEKLEFREIVLSHIRKISDITTVEFRGGYDKETVVGNQIVKEYVPDSRKQYIQTVEFLSDILLPYFDKEMNDSYKKIMGKIKPMTTGIKAKKKLTDREVRNYTLKKLGLCRELFQALSLLLFRTKYLRKKKVI